MIYLQTNLKHLRKKNNYTLVELGKLIDKTNSAVLYWEQGSREPSVNDLVKLSNLYKVSIDDLIKKDLREE